MMVMVDADMLVDFAHVIDPDPPDDVLATLMIWALIVKHTLVF
jgi:hypothetical protein